MDRAEAREKKITPDEVRANRDKALEKNKKYMAHDQIVYMSDEMSGSDGESTRDGTNRSISADVDGQSKTSVERPGNAQYLETPTVTMPIDFSGITSESLFGKQKEVYRLKAHKLEGLVDCQLCKLIFDYTKACKHFTMDTDLKAEELKDFVNQSQENKLHALSKITRSLDILSTARVTSFMLKKQIAELLSMYMQKNANAALSSHFKNFKAVYCDKCKQPDGEEEPRFDPSVLALKILNRCFTFQIEAIIMN